MKPRQDNHIRLYALIAVSVTLAAYTLARPDGIVDTATKSLPVQRPSEGPQKVTPSATVIPSAFADGEDDDGSLDLPIDGESDGNSGDSRVEDIPNSMTVDDSGALVPAPPPAMSDHSITSEDEVPGAE